MINIPSVKECLELMDKYSMPEHIKLHSLEVRNVAVYLASELNSKGESLDVKTIEASALLHDIAKIQCVNTNKKHTKMGADILRKEGYDEIADIVAQHVNLWSEYKTMKEEEIVNYSDKRVMHDKVVTLPERFADLKLRYDVEIVNVCKTQKKAEVLEKKIFKNLDFSPDDLIGRI